MSVYRTIGPLVVISVPRVTDVSSVVDTRKILIILSLGLETNASLF